MKSDLIIGSVFLIIGISLICFSKPPSFPQNTKWWKSSLATLSYNGFISMLLLLGYLHLSMFCLNLKGSDITWKNGIYLFFSITALIELTYRIIIRLKRNGDK